jgi:hypothetical protein
MTTVQYNFILRQAMCPAARYTNLSYPREINVWDMAERVQIVGKK